MQNEARAQNLCSVIERRRLRLGEFRSSRTRRTSGALLISSAQAGKARQPRGSQRTTYAQLVGARARCCVPTERESLREKMI